MIDAYCRYAEGLWIVEHCPLCQQTHTHGAGVGKDPHMALGHRVSHCTSDNGYNLVCINQAEECPWGEQ